MNSQLISTTSHYYKNLELTVGGIYGYQVEHRSKKTFSYALPLLQGKYLFRETKPNQPPGFGMVLGTFLPVGAGSFKPVGMEHLVTL